MNAGLLLIEFQHDWLHPKGKLHHLIQDKGQLQQSIDYAKAALAHARNSGMTVIHSGLSFAPGYHELGPATQGLRSLIRKNQPFLQGSQGCEFFDGFTPIQGELVVSGRLGSSAFSGSNLDLLCRHHGLDTLYIMGYALHVCVESTLRAAHDLGYTANVITDACAAFNQAQQYYVINEVIPHFGQGITTEAFVKENDLTAINQTIEDYFRGTHEADIARIHHAFHPDAKITGMFDGVYSEMTLKQFIARIREAVATREKNTAYDKSILTIDHHHNIAMVKARVLVNEEYFTDYITLLKIDGQWIIRQKSFTNLTIA